MSSPRPPAPDCSPSRKRMRLSSPTFDDQVGDLSQDDLNAFDSLDAQLSQSFPDLTRLTQPSHTAHSVTHDLPVVDDESPFRSDKPCTPRTARIHAPFMNASAIDYSRLVDEPSDEAELLDEAPPEVDYAAWFNSDASNSFVGFSAAATAMPAFQRPSISGKSANSFFVPSAAALQEAEEKMRKWQEDVHLPDQVPTHKVPGSPHSTQPVSPPRATFSSAKNTFSSMHAPKTPTPTSSAGLTLAESHSSLQSVGGKRQTKPFKSPLITTTPSMLPHRQVSAPGISSPLRGYHSSATAPSQTATPILPLRPSSVMNHVMTQHPLGFTPKHGSITMRPKFVTPFKAAVKSGTPVENRKLPSTPFNPRTTVNRIYPPSVPSPRPCKRNSDERIFDLSEHRL